MATNETSRGYRYPDGNEPPALDVLLGNLAEDVNDDVQAQVNRVQTGSKTLTSPTTATASAGAVTFATPFSAAPVVLITTPISGGGVRVSTYAIGVTATGFNLRYRADGAYGSDVDAQWVAIGPAS